MQNPSSNIPPESDSGSVAAFKYPFSLAHKRQYDGGWSREVTVRELPIAKSMAGVDMRLTAGGVRELHWHTAGEWAIMLYGNARITAIDKATILKLLVKFGTACQQFLDARMQGLKLTHLQFDEQWTYVAKKQSRLTVNERAELSGVDEERVSATISEPAVLLVARQEPQTGWNLRRVEELSGQPHHAVH